MMPTKNTVQTVKVNVSLTYFLSLLYCIRAGLCPSLPLNVSNGTVIVTAILVGGILPCTAVVQDIELMEQLF